MSGNCHVLNNLAEGIFVRTYLVPNVWAVAVGKRTKLAQKKKKMPQTHMANKVLPPYDGANPKVKYRMAIKAEVTHMQLRYPNLSHMWPQKTLPPALKMAAKAPTTAKKWSSVMKTCP